MTTPAAPQTHALQAATVCSWSGGKDSALALQLAVEAGARPAALLTMLDESGRRSRSHGIPVEVLAAQASALDLPLATAAASWDAYTSTFTDALDRLARRHRARACVFGDIDVEAHRDWCRARCEGTGIVALHPLWQRPRRELVETFLRRGFRATVVVVRDGALDASLLGRELDTGLLEEIEAAGADACGENGEYHTVVTDGPSFARPLRLRHGRVLRVADCHALELAPR